MQNPFDQFDNAPAKKGPVYGAPKPVDPYKEEDQQFKRNAEARANRDQQIQEQKLNVELRKDAREAAVETDKLAKLETSKTDAVRSVRNVLDKILEVGKDANDNSGWFETGMSGSLMRGIPGTAAYDLQGNLNTIDAQSAFTALQKMRDASLTGGALGNITEKELELLKQSVSNLDPNQGHEQFLGNLKNAYAYYLDTLKRISPEDAATYRDTRKESEAQSIFAPGSILDNPSAPPPSSSPPKGGGMGNAFLSGVGDIVEGVGDLAGLVNNPLNAGINYVGEQIGHNPQLTTDLGAFLRKASGLPDPVSPMASAINKGGISAMLPAGGANALLEVGATKAGPVMNALAQQPITQVAAGAGAGASAETTKQAGLPPLAQFIAGLGGGIATFGGIEAATNALAPKVVTPTMEAAARQGVDLMPADVGGPTVGRLSSAAAQGPISAQPVMRAAQKANSQFGQATGRASEGSRLAPDDAGEVVRQAGERFTTQSRERGGALYSRAENMARGVRIKPKGAIQVIDDQIAQLREAGEINAPLIAELTKFRSSLAQNDGLRIGGMRDIRTGASKAAYSDDLRSTPAQRVFSIVADAIGQDIDLGLAQAGRGNAAQAFKTADTYWKDRVQYIDSVLEPIIGAGKSGENVLMAVESMAQGKGKGVQTLVKLLRSVGKDDAADIQATIIDRMGKSTAGQQGAEGNSYSAATFLTNWNKMSVKGKSALFPDPKTRQNLDDLARVAESMKASSRYANSSNTAGGLAGQIVLSGGLGTMGLTPFLLGSGAQYISGRLLASPRFARWLATVPKNPQAQQAHMNRLGAIASAEPLIANDIASVQKFLSQTPASPAVAAASERDDVEN